MNQLDKDFLNDCIIKYRKGKFTQSQLCERLCSKYTLSRLENGLHCKDSLYHQLLNRLGYTFDDYIESISVFVIMKDTLTQMIEGNRLKISENIIRLENMLSKYTHHIKVKELQFYIQMMRQHYIEETIITISIQDCITLSHYQNDYYLVFMNTICENLLFYNNLKGFIIFMNTYKRDVHHILLDYYLMRYYQCQDRVVESDELFKQYKNKFIENNDHTHYFQYLTIESLSYISSDVNHSISLLKELYTLSKSIALHPFYTTGMHMGFLYLCILNNKHHEAIDIIEEAYLQCDRFFDLFIPYAIFIYLRNNKPLPNQYIKNPVTLMSIDCIQYYNLIQQGAKHSKLVNQLTKKVIRHCSLYGMRAPFTVLVKGEISRTFQISRCHQSVLRLDTLLNEVCK